MFALQAGIYPGLALLISSWYRRGRAVVGQDLDVEILTES